jgi:hypothetical protein
VQRADRHPQRRLAGEGILKAPGRGSVTSADAGEDADPADRGGIESAAAACRPQQEAPAVFAGQRHQQPAALCQAVEPQRRGMRRAGADDDGVDLAGIVRAPVAGHHLDLRPGGKVVPGARRQLSIVLDRHDTARRSDDLGKDGGVVAGAGADLQHALAALQVEMIEIMRPETRHAVVEAARRVDADQHVVVDPVRRVVGRHERQIGLAERYDAPGAGAQEPLARHGGIGIDDGRVVQHRHPQLQVLGIPAAQYRGIVVHGQSSVARDRCP